jgi:large subunit ribosomal protein L29
MFASEIRELTIDEVEQKLEESYHELMNLRFQKASGQLLNYNRIREVRRTVARLKVVRGEKR